MDRKLKGLREYQTEREMKSQLSILKILSWDEAWHRYSELREETKLNDSTLAKQLTRLREINLIEKQKDKKSGEYPHPVNYRLNPVYANAFRGNSRSKRTWKNMKEDLWKRRNLVEILNDINKQNDVALFGILINIIENETINDTIKRLLLELLIWKPYKSLIWHLVKEAECIFNIEELRESVQEV